MQIADLVSERSESVKSLDKVSIKWHIVTASLLREILDGLPYSHGRDSPFIDEVQSLGEVIGINEASIERKGTEEQWMMLRNLADQAFS